MNDYKSFRKPLVTARLSKVEHSPPLAASIFFFLYQNSQYIILRAETQQLHRNRVIWHMHQPLSINVPRFVGGPTPDYVRAQTSLLLNKTLKSTCDTIYVLSDERAIQLLASIKAVISIQRSTNLDVTMTVETLQQQQNEFLQEGASFWRAPTPKMAQ